MPKFRSAEPLADIVEDALAPACRRHGFASAALVLYWPDIVGEAVARHAQPERLSWPRSRTENGEAREPGTLVVRVDAGAALTLQHTSAQVIERINAVFGWRAVGRLKLVQRPLETAPPRPVVRAKPPADRVEQARRAFAAGIDHPVLAGALARLGAHIAGEGVSSPGGSRS